MGSRRSAASILFGEGTTEANWRPSQGVAAHVAGAPEVERLGDELVLRRADHGVSLSFDRFHEESGGLHAEIAVSSAVAGELTWQRLNLASGPARAGLVKQLDRVLPTVPWRSCLETACRTVVLAMRPGEPATPLVPSLRPAGESYLVPKIAPAGEITVAFADGGSGKSLLALWLSAAVAGGFKLPHDLTPTATCPTLDP